MKIIIAEKPSVAQEYARVLGVKSNNQTDGFIENDKWIVTWTVGHLITMSYPEKYNPDFKEWRLDTLPFIPNSFKYEPIQATFKQFKIVRSLYNRPDIETIYYAGDSGREGLYIQMLVRESAGHNPTASEKVVWIDSQTEDEILRGITEAKPLSEYENMSDAGHMRAIADYLIGINFSRELSVLYSAMLNSGSGQKKQMPISVGRVMTCVLGMIVNREREIRNFKVKDFYRIAGLINIDGTEIECEWRECESSKYYHSPKLYSEFGFSNETDALELINSLSQKLEIRVVERINEKKNAPLLYNLAELQGECSRLLHISPSQTLSIAQSLYEKKLTTYPRTDARVLSSAVAREIGINLEGLKNGAYSSFVKIINDNHYSLGNKYIDDSQITDHYAIIPTGKAPNDLSNKEEAVYELITKRFLAAFYPMAEFLRIKFEAISNGELFVGTKRIIAKTGFYDVLGLPEEDIASKTQFDNISKLMKGMSYASSFNVKKGATSPPRRYTSGSMILAMENAGNLIEDDELREQISSVGIGTSATRAEIVDKLIRLKYVSENEKNQILTPTNFGEMVYEVVDMSIPDLLSPTITADWERSLDQIVKGNISKQTFEKEFFTYIRTKCEEIKQSADEKREQIKRKIRPLATNRIQMEYKEFDPYNTKIKCPLCGDEVETTSWGFKCKSNISKTEGCSFVMGDILGHMLLTNELATLLYKGKVGPFYDFVSTKNKPFAASLIWNQEAKKVEFELADMPWNETKMICPYCGKKILSQGKYFRCEGYIDKDNGCKFWLGKIAGKSMSEKLVKQLLENGQTELIQGFKNSEGNKFDAFLVLDKEQKKVSFKFPNAQDLETSYRCPICNGKILKTAYGFKCENYVSPENFKEGDCSFWAGTIMGHTIKEKELAAIVGGMETELVTFKNNDKKQFEARMYWDKQNKRIAFKFDENIPLPTDIKCPLCNSFLNKNKFGYVCSTRISKTEGCQFFLGSIMGVIPEETQVRKLMTIGKTDLIPGFKPKEKEKNPFSAYLVWNQEEKKIQFEFPNKEDMKEKSNYSCPFCQERMYKSQYGYYCNCGFKIASVMASVEIPEEQIRKLIVKGESDLIYGFCSRRTRKLFNAKLVIDYDKKEIGFSFPDKDGGEES